MIDKGYYTIKDLADLAGVSKQAVAKLIKAAGMECDFVEKNRKYYSAEKAKAIIGGFPKTANQTANQQPKTANQTANQQPKTANQTEILCTRDYLFNEALAELYDLRFDRAAYNQKYQEYKDIAKSTYRCKQDWKTALKEYFEQEKELFAQDNYVSFDCDTLPVLNLGVWEYGRETGCIYYTDNECNIHIACNHPILPVERYRNIDTATIKILLAYNFNGRWQELLINRDMIVSKPAIYGLAKHGIDATQQNANNLVKYFRDIENLNRAVLSEKLSVGRLGWVDDKTFVPYSKNLVFDGENAYKVYFDSVQPCGDYGKWLAAAKEIRAGRHIQPKIMLAASFASVLVEPLKVLSFLVHLWSASGSGYGKTVSLMLAASVWANPTPGQFIHNFSDTLVGLEKTAAFFNSLPNCIDELQTLRNKDNKNKIIYMLAQGSGRTRGTRQNTVAAAGYWHNCTLTTGEEPLTTDNGQDGSINRVLELECYSDMFDGAAARIADTVKENYGHAGKLFIENLINTDTELIKTIYEGFNRVLIADEVNSTNKQAAAAALILTADYYADQFIFQDGNTLQVEDLISVMKTKEEVSSGERGMADLKSWIIENKNKFDDTSPDFYGKIDLSIKTAYILTGVFKKFCLTHGYNQNVLREYLDNNGYLGDRDRKGFAKTIKCNGKASMFYCFNIDDEMAAALRCLPWVGETDD